MRRKFCHDVFVCPFVITCYMAKKRAEKPWLIRSILREKVVSISRKNRNHLRLIIIAWHKKGLFFSSGHEGNKLWLMEERKKEYSRNAVSSSYTSSCLISTFFFGAYYLFSVRLITHWQDYLPPPRLHLLFEGTWRLIFCQDDCIFELLL